VVGRMKEEDGAIEREREKVSLVFSVSRFRRKKNPTSKTHVTGDGDDVEPAVLPHVLGELDALEHELVRLSRAGAAVLVDEPPVVHNFKNLIF